MLVAYLEAHPNEAGVAWWTNVDSGIASLPCSRHRCGTSVINHGVSLDLDD